MTSFLLSDGQNKKPAKVAASIRTIGQLLDSYLGAIPEASLEKATPSWMKTHSRHLKRVLGTRFPLSELTRGQLQSYIDARGVVRKAGMAEH